MSSVIKTIYFTTIITFCSLYAAQPIQPVFQTEFHLTNLQAILFTTLMMAPLSVAPLFYGYILEAYSARALLRAAVGMLAVLELIFSCVSSYVPLLVIRGLQGMMIPAILTSLVSYISYSAPRESVQHSIAVYIAATIVGGFLGRFLSGLFTDLVSWRLFFFLLGIALACAYWMLRNLEKDVKMEYARPNIKEYAALLRQPQFRWIYLSIFCLFLVFSGMMNFLPFELKKMNISLSETGVGLLYFGYSIGVLVSVNSRRIIRFFGNEPDAVTAGIALFLVGTLIFSVERYPVMFMAMFVFCAGLFIAHSLLSGLVNKLALDNRAIANGVYISFYYAGGTIGSFAPGLVFELFGWKAFLGTLLSIIAVAGVFVRLLKAAVTTAERAAK